MTALHWENADSDLDRGCQCAGRTLTPGLTIPPLALPNDERRFFPTSHTTDELVCAIRFHRQQAPHNSELLLCILLDPTKPSILLYSGDKDFYAHAITTKCIKSIANVVPTPSDWVLCGEIAPVCYDSRLLSTLNAHYVFDTSASDSTSKNPDGKRVKRYHVEDGVLWFKAARTPSSVHPNPTLHCRFTQRRSSC
ncbi:hypothetical protein cyc_00315 [Cyclospora cayetanensis]|uniref:Uncharacterized protein n=1 Tax=Cyclospora cayetanensis TaxID=88456 RepID=A0A1D3CTD3_9EIME|nr:hypothetical protein cyc_00315 [Cyclospora cayetanensis]